MFPWHTPLLVVQEKKLKLIPLLVVQEKKLKLIPLLVVQEKLKTFNVGQAFETQLELHKIFTDSHSHLITSTGSSGKA